MLELLIGRDWTVNSDAVMNDLTKDVAAGKCNRILLVPELISHDTERRLCELAGDTVSRYATVTGFSRLPGLIGRYCKIPVPECTDQAGCVAAMASAARQLHSSLKTYASVETKPEFLLQMVDAVDEFKRCRITPTDLHRVSSECSGELAQKIQELALLYEAYDAICAHGKRDPRDLLEWALEAMQDSDFAENHVFYIDGFPDFTVQHMAILEHLIQFSPRVVVSMNCDCLDSNELAFQKAAQTASHLMKYARSLAQNRGEKWNSIRTIPERNDYLRPVRQAVFQGQTCSDISLQQWVHLYTVDSAHRECQAAAEDIRNLVRNGARYRDIAVVCADMQKFRAVLGMTFRRMDIPFYLSGTELVSDSFAMNTVFAAIEAVQNGFEKSAMRRYLRSTLSPLDADTCDMVENYIFVWGIQGRDWTKPWTKHPAGLSDTWLSSDRDALNKLEQARNRVMLPLLHLQYGFNTAKKVSDQVHAIYHFLEEVQLAQRMDTLAQELDDRGDNRSAQVVNQLWDILLTALEQLEDILGETAWDSDVFSRLLMLLLSQYDVGTIPTVLDSVTVGPVSAMRCQRPKHLIVIGCAEGKLPGFSGSKSVLSDADRGELRKRNVNLTGGDMDGIQVEFSEVYGVFCGVSESIHLYCSDPQPSFVFRRIQRLLGCDSLPQRSDISVSNVSDAAAYLLRHDAADQAEDLGILQEFQSLDQRRKYDIGHISGENVRKLYGDVLQFSASKVDTYAKCRLKFFLQYGLRLNEQREATVDPIEYGVFVHAVLENTVRDVMSQGGFAQHTVSQVCEIAADHANAHIRKHFTQLDSKRMKYLIERNLQEVDWIVRDLWDELRQAKYAPVFEEYDFGLQSEDSAIPIPGASMEALLTGKVDRIDMFTLTDENNPDMNRKYYRVVDYKTGRISIEYRALLYGIGLQMFLYLFALQDNGRDLLGEDAIPAGVQYFRANANYLKMEGKESSGKPKNASDRKPATFLLNDDLSVEAMDPNPDMPRLSCKRNKNGMLQGYVADGQQLKTLRNYVFKVLADFVDEIADGCVTPNPYQSGDNAVDCSKCAFNTICNYGQVPEARTQPSIKEDEFWDIIQRRCEDDG